MSKEQIGLYLDPATAAELRRRASSSGASVSDLAGLAIRGGLAKLTDDAIAAWVTAQPLTRGRLGGGLNQGERLILGAFGHLKAAEAGTWRFSLTALANQAGITFKGAWLALKRLEGRGLVKGAELAEVDRWGRPIKSVWHLTADAK